MIPEEVLASSRHLHIGSYFLLGGMRDHFYDMAKRAKTYGATVSLDTNWDPDEKWGEEIIRLLELTDVLLPNENEAMLISGEGDAESAIKKLSGYTPLVVVKMGKEGAMAADGKNIYKRGIYDVCVADAIGAGDSFDAGFIYGYLNDCDINTCLDMACFCAGMSTRAHGGTSGQADKKEFDSVFL